MKASVEKQADWDHSSHANFYEYYANESATPATRERFRRVKETLVGLLPPPARQSRLRVADVGCGAGAQAAIWAADGHQVHGLDVNEPLIALARERARNAGLEVAFEVGTATALPWNDESMDVCILPELLEHVADWRSCLNEAARVLAPGGLLYLSTTNVLCPKQQEFSLPAYSWYPPVLKRHFEKLSLTSRPAIANYARYPAVNWFSFYGLRRFLEPLGFRCLDRFDLIDESSKDPLRRGVVRALRSSAALRFIGHIATPSVVVVGIKH